MLAVVGMLAFNYQVTLPLIAERTFGGTATTFTLLFATMSLGSVAGALVVARQTDLGVGFLVRAGTGLAVATFALAFAPTLPLAVLAAVAVGFTNVGIISGANAVVQLRAAPLMRGRVLALLSVVFLGSTPIGSPIIGFVAEQLGPRVAIALGGVATALVVAWVARQVRALSSVESTPDSVVAEPEAALALRPAAA